MACRESELHWDAWQKGEAPADFLNHLENCAECLAQVKSFQRVSAWMSLREQEPPQLSPGFWVRFWEKQAAARDNVWDALAVLARRASVALAVIVLLLFLSFQWLPNINSNERAVIDAPQPYWVQVSGQANGNGDGPNRDQVVLTLVSQAE